MGLPRPRQRPYEPLFDQLVESGELSSEDLNDYLSALASSAGEIHRVIGLLKEHGFVAHVAVGRLNEEDYYVRLDQHHVLQTASAFVWTDRKVRFTELNGTETEVAASFNGTYTLTELVMIAAKSMYDSTKPSEADGS